MTNSFKLFICTALFLFGIWAGGFVVLNTATINVTHNTAEGVQVDVQAMGHTLIYWIES